MKSVFDTMRNLLNNNWCGTNNIPLKANIAARSPMFLINYTCNLEHWASWTEGLLFKLQKGIKFKNMRSMILLNAIRKLFSYSELHRIINVMELRLWLDQTRFRPGMVLIFQPLFGIFMEHTSNIELSMLNLKFSQR